MGSRGPLPVGWSSETARRRNTFFPETTPSPPEDVSPPEGLDDAALAFWHRHAPSLISSGRLRASMASGFAILCQLAVDCERLSREVSEEGTVIGSKANPKTRLLRDARRDFLTFSKAFGLDPASSARIPNSPTEAADSDPLALYISQKAS